MAVILVISNPVSGNGNGPAFIRDHVLPLLQSANLKYELVETREAGTAGRLAVNFLEKHKYPIDATIVVSGGDGTVHEVVNGIGHFQPEDDISPENPYAVRIVLCPQGTANALFSTHFPRSNDDAHDSVRHRLRSLRAFLDGNSRLLTLTRTQVFGNDGRVVETFLGVVVTSTALHAAILRSADHLRASIPAIERFKVAAAENISTWYHGLALIHPSKIGGKVKIFDSRLMAFKPLDFVGGSEIHLAGPYVYFLSTVNVDRLEPDFQISPLFAALPPETGELDLLVIRPLRDPSIETENAESRAKFMKTTSAVLQAAYSHGAHITKRYANDRIEYSENGLHVVEYIRCGGWEWKPNDADEAAHIVCVDGVISRVGTGGRVSCHVINDAMNVQFRICA